MLRFPVLIGDIGGTNARFAVVADTASGPGDIRTVAAAAYPTIEDAIRATVPETGGLRPRSALLAVAAPVDGDEIDLTNSHWIVRPRAMLAALGLDEIVVLNDFEAQALGVVAIAPEHLETIGGGAPEPEASRVVLGPGTGLGVAGLVRSRGLWIPVPGEGGHVDIGPRSPRDFEVFAHVERIEGRLSGEQMLCGPGLVNLYRAVAAAEGDAPRFADPAAITAAALSASDAVAVEALDIFVTCLGRIAGDMALIFLSRGGVFLTGGIAQKIVPALKTGSFRAAFEDKAPHGALMRAMPVHVVTHPFAAMVGLAAYAAAPDRFGVETEGRRWAITELPIA